MLFLRSFALLTMSSFTLSGGASGCHARQPANSQTDKPAPAMEREPPIQAELKVLAEGSQSAIKNPFVALVRDADTYSALTKLDGNLPRLDADFFKENVVLAAFLGERNTGGYSVEITSSPVDINVLEKKPGKDMMVTQMITSPFKIVALQGVSNAAVRLNLLADDAWWQQLRQYQVTSGSFRMSGGIAGVTEEFRLEGPVAVMREGNLASFSFRIVGSGTKKRRLLMEYATGLLDGENKIQINRMSADSLINPPNTGLQAEGVFSAGGKKLSLNLLSRPSMIADGYSGQGSIDAGLATAATKP